MGNKPNYGIDRPDIVAFLAAFGTVSFFLGAFSTVPGGLGISIGVTSFAVAAIFVVGSKVFKLPSARKLLDTIAWRGDESVLDIGCGRGLLLVNAGKRLATGRAVGIDIWSRQLQSGNRPEAALENARFEGVLPRVEVMSGDARHLPFRTNAFDVVTSSLVYHHVPERDKRGALSEATRVLKPGGHLALIELSHAVEYAGVFAELGMTDIRVSSPRPLLFFGARTLTARKAAS